MSKAISFSSIMPSISSVTKKEAKAPANFKRATGRVINMSAKTSSKTAVKTASTRSTRSGFGLRSVARALAGNIAYINAFCLLAVVVGLGFYVFMINAYASKGYELKRQQAAIDELTETQKQLVIQQAASGSIVKVNDLASTSGMVPVSGEEFLVANQISHR